MLNKEATSEDICSDLHLLTYSLQHLIWSVTKPREHLSIRASRTGDSRVAKPSTGRNSHEKEEKALMAKITAIAPLFPLVMQALDSLGQDRTFERLQGFAIYAVVKTFQKLSEAICNVACTQSRSIENDHANGNATPRRGSSRASRASAVAKMTDDESIAAQLSQLFISMLACLNICNQVHSEVLEGVLFHFLGKIGCLLKSATGDGPIGLEDGNVNIGVEAPDLEVKRMTIQAQAPYLTLLLERMLRIANEASQVQSLSSPPIGDIPTGISGIPRMKLQHTLLRAVFGEDGVDFHRQSLRRPTLPCDSTSIIQPSSKLDTFDSGAKFTMDIWRLLGWDVIRESA